MLICSREKEEHAGDITPLPLRKVSARKMYGGDHHACEQCRDVGQGVWALRMGLFPWRSVPMATIMDAWDSMGLWVFLQVILARPIVSNWRSVLYLQSYLSLDTSPACSPTPRRRKVRETPVEAAGKPAVTSSDICLWLLNAPPAFCKLLHLFQL